MIWSGWAVNLVEWPITTRQATSEHSLQHFSQPIPYKVGHIHTCNIVFNCVFKRTSQHVWVILSATHWWWNLDDENQEYGNHFVLQMTSLYIMFENDYDNHQHIFIKCTCLPYREASSWVGSWSHGHPSQGFRVHRVCGQICTGKQRGMVRFQ